jgi:hypothetical protein
MGTNEESLIFPPFRWRVSGRSGQEIRWFYCFAADPDSTLTSFYDERNHS